MRLLCLYFPRLGAQLALRRSPHLQCRSVALLSQTGDASLVTAVSAIAAARGVLTGMRAGDARLRDPACAFLPDNVGVCLDELERMESIIRARATPLVEIGGRDHLFVDLDGTESQFPGEAVAARRFHELATAWTGLDVRAGIGSTRRTALAAARAARLQPGVDAETDSAGECPVAPFADEGISVCVPLERGDTPAAARAKIVRALGRLQAVLNGRRQGFRELHVSVTSAGRTTEDAERLNPPCFAAGDLLERLGAALTDNVLSGAGSVTIDLRRLCPDIRIRPWSLPVTQRQSPRPRVLRPRQLLLRATG
jgi:hypothetical protein